MPSDDGRKEGDEMYSLNVRTYSPLRGSSFVSTCRKEGGEMYSRIDEMPPEFLMAVEKFICKWKNAMWAAMDKDDPGVLRCGPCRMEGP